MEDKKKNIDDVVRNIILNADWIEWPESAGGKTQEPITIPEIEGDPGNGYWYVCGECHGYLKWHEDPCPHCGWRINWHG